MKTSRELILGEVVYIAIIYHIPDSRIYLLNCYDFSSDHMTVGSNSEFGGRSAGSFPEQRLVIEPNMTGENREYVCLQTFLCVYCIYLVELMSLNFLVILHFVRSRFKCSCFRATLFTVLRTVYAIGPGLVQARPSFDSPCGSHSKILARNCHSFTRWHSTGRYYQFKFKITIIKYENPSI